MDAGAGRRYHELNSFLQEGVPAGRMTYKLNKYLQAAAGGCRCRQKVL